MKIFKNLAFLALGVFGLYSCEKSIQDFGKVDLLGADDVIVKINMASIYPDDRYMYVKFDQKLRLKTKKIKQNK